DEGATIIGICGGFQMLGQRVADPAGIESATSCVEGLSLVPVETVLTAHKRTEAVEATTSGGTSFGAYAIHAGRTSVVGSTSVEPFATLSDGTRDGVRGNRVIGTYLHGAFESVAICEEIFGVCPFEDLKTSSYERLADWFDAHVRHVDQWGLPVMKG